MMKKIGIGVVVLIVLVGFAVWYLFMNLDHYIKVAVEKYGSQATQTTVSLDSVKLSLSSGQGELSGLSVSNPKGFSSAKAFNLGSITVQVDASSVTGNGPIIIKSVDIEQPQVGFELATTGDTNLQTIQKNAQNYAASMAGKQQGNAGATQASASGGGGRKMIINDLTIHNGQVAISAAPLKGKQLSAPLPTIHLTDIGKNSGGATAAQVAQQLISSVSGAAARVGITELAKEKISGALERRSRQRHWGRGGRCRRQPGKGHIRAVNKGLNACFSLPWMRL